MLSVSMLGAQGYHCIACNKTRSHRAGDIPSRIPGLLLGEMQDPFSCQSGSADNARSLQLLEMLQSRLQLLPHTRQRPEVDRSCASCTARPWLLIGLAHCLLQAAKNLLERSAALLAASDCGQRCSCMHPALQVQCATVSEKIRAAYALCKPTGVCECQALRWLCRSMIGD